MASDEQNSLRFPRTYRGVNSNLRLTDQPASGYGPFFQYLADRRAKGFAAVLIKYLNGFDDGPASQTEWPIPQRPPPADEDWVLCLEKPS